MTAGERYKNRTRIRVNGLLLKDQSILLVQVKSPVKDRLVWMPPGGGLEFGESMKECLQREFAEETGLRISAGSLIAVNEMVKPPFHAVECYFEVFKEAGELLLGKDPEHAENEQVLKDLQWIPLEQLDTIDLAPRQLQEWALQLRSSNEYPQRYFQAS